MTAYECRNEVIGKLRFRLGELRAKREYALSLNIQDAAAISRLEGNIGSLEWAAREIAAMEPTTDRPPRHKSGCSAQFQLIPGDRCAQCGAVYPKPVAPIAKICAHANQNGEGMHLISQPRPSAPGANGRSK